jgi:hypothetical protein
MMQGCSESIINQLSSTVDLKSQITRLQIFDLKYRSKIG